MLLRKLDSETMRSSRVAVPVGTALMITGMMSILLATVLTHDTAGFLGFTDHADFARGFVVGCALVIELAGCVLLFRAAGTKRI